MRLIDADALLKIIPSEDVTSRMAVVNAPTINQWIPCDQCEKRCDKWESLKTSQE